MTANEYYDSLKQILDHYGADAQRMKACEELAELIVEIAHTKSPQQGTQETPIRLLDEVADVYVMLTQITMIYGLNTFKVMEKQEEKINRQLKRIEAEKSDDN